MPAVPHPTTEQKAAALTRMLEVGRGRLGVVRDAEARTTHGGRDRGRRRCRPAQGFGLTVADPAQVFPPGRLLGIAEEIRPGDMMVMAELAAAQAGSCRC